MHHYQIKYFTATYDQPIHFLDDAGYAAAAEIEPATAVAVDDAISLRGAFDERLPFSELPAFFGRHAFFASARGGVFLESFHGVVAAVFVAAACSADFVVRGEVVDGSALQLK